MQAVNEPVIAYCGLVCTNCGAYRRRKCAGCFSDKPMFRNCPVKKCAGEKHLTTCADCGEYKDLKQCKKLNSFVAKVFQVVFRSNRIGNLERIRKDGLELFKKSLSVS
jgi:hypothetical protein